MLSLIEIEEMITALHIVKGRLPLTAVLAREKLRNVLAQLEQASRFAEEHEKKVGPGFCL